MKKEENNIEKIYPLTPMQEGMLFHSIRDNSDAYFNQLFYTTKGKIDVEVFSKSLEILSKRHDILRTAFVYEKTERPIQVVLKNRKIALTLVDKTMLNASEYHDFLEQYKENDINKGFDLVKESVIRITIIKREEELYDFLWSYHHILLDGWCHAILVEEISEIYSSLKQNRKLELPDPIPFSNYVKWLEKQDKKQSEKYWNEYLNDYNQIAEIPKVLSRDTTDLSNPHKKIVFSKELTIQLTREARENGITLNDIFQTIWGLLLSKYSGTNDVVYGNVVSGRPTELEGIDRCLGLFINTIPVRLQYSNEDTLVQIAKRIHNDFLNGLPHHYSSLADIQNNTVLKGDLVKHIIAFENYPISELNEEQKQDNLFEISNVSVFDRTNYDFDIDVELAEEISVTFYYNSQNYDINYIEKVADTFSTLTNQFAKTPHKTITEVSFVSKEGIQELLYSFNKGNFDLNNTQPINVLFEEEVKCKGNRIAVIHNNEKWTYQELNNKSNQIAHSLIEVGLQRGEFVGIHIERTFDMVAALLGVFKAGGVYVPLDIQNPTSRTVELLKDGEIKALISVEKQLQLLTKHSFLNTQLKQVLCVDTDITDEKFAIDSSVSLINKRKIELCSIHNPENINKVNDWAYMLYTSGSTGKPKGAITRHDGAMNHILAEYEAMQLQDGFCFLQSASIASDISVWQILAPILRGGSVVIADKEDVLDYQKTLDLMKEHKVTIAEFVPSYLIGFVDHILEINSSENILPSLQWMMMVGEEIPVKLVNNWLQLFPGCRVLNGYGPCEASDDITQYEIVKPIPVHLNKVPIGKPILNMNIFVLDANEKLVPVGVPGEICVSGVGVGAGYFKEPEKTANSFRPNPFPNTLGNIMYKTGDLGRWLPDGNLEFLGRKDRQVKIRGNRVELGEIESIIRENDLVDNAAVVAYKKDISNTSLIAFATKTIVPVKPNFDISFEKEREKQMLQFEFEGLKNKTMSFDNGLKIFSLNNSETTFVFKEIFEDKAYLQHGIELKPKSVVFDVGANIGMFSLMVATCFPGSKVYAFEPIPPTFQIMEANAKLYNSYSDIYTYNAGLSNEKKTITFTHYPKNSMLSGMYGDKSKDKEYIKNVILQQITTNDLNESLDKDIEYQVNKLAEEALLSENYNCQLLTISEIIAEQNIDRIDLLKIDVERSERDVLEGINKTDWDKIQQIVIEVHDNDDSLNKVLELLNKKGFVCSVEQEKLLVGTDLYNIYAYRKNRDVDTSLILALQEKCAKELPLYMQPDEFCIIDKLPQNLSDKVDEKKLVSIYKERFEGITQASGLIKPCDTNTEREVKNIWEQILQRNDIGADEDFFEKGGHSLLAMRVKAAVLKKLKVQLEVKDLFIYTKLNELAALIDKKSLQEEGEIKAYSRTENIPLSYSQESIWFLDQLHGGSSEYHIPAALKFKGKINVELLEDCLREIIDRHEVLRSIVNNNQEIPCLEFLNSEKWSLEVIKEKFVDESELESKIVDLIERPFNLTKDYKLKASLIQYEKTKSVLVLVMHHFASDGWSEGILVDELLTLYKAKEKNQAVTLPQLKIQYADYILWQQGRKKVVEEQLIYWKEQLSEAQPLEFPTDFNRPKNKSTEGGTVEVVIPMSIEKALRQLSSSYGGTLFMTLLSAFKIILHKYSGQNDICVGTPIAGRSHQEFENLIGFFVNTLALRSYIEGETSVKAYLKQVKDTSLEAYKNQDAPFDKVVEATVKQRDLNRNPIYQVMFTYQNTPESQELVFEDLEVEVVKPSEIQVHSELHFIIEEDSDKGLILEIEYRKDLFNLSTIERLANHYMNLLNSIVENPEQKICELKMLNKEEVTQLIDTFNHSNLDFSKNATVLSTFKEQVIKSPKAIALIHDNDVLTYEELEEKSNQIAHYLNNNGIVKGDLIPICMERSILTIVGIFGIIKSGAAYVPIDPTNPSDRISFIIQDSEAKLVITHTELKNKIQGCTEVACVTIDSMEKEIGILPSTELSITITQDDLAYIIYTSGTTGRPKGAMIEHRALNSFLEFTNHTHPLTSGEKMTFKTNYGFDMAIPEIFGWIMGGASMVIVSDSDVKDLGKFIKVLAEKEVTQLNLVPSHLSVFVDYILTNNISLPSLRYFLIGGEVLPVKTVQAYQKSNLTASLDNIYGPTETTVFSNYFTANNLSEKAQTVPIGKPTPNAQIYILGDDLSLLPVGVIGELCIGGLGLGRGYLNRNELNAEKFIKNPYKKGGRLYKTGDLAKWLPDGTVSYIGRKDSQVKVNGYRIELGEIEAVLDQCVNIKQSVVITREIPDGGKQLVAYVTVSDGELNSDQLQKQLLLKLPEYMVPKVYVAMEKFPLNRNGKIDRNQLPDAVSLNSIVDSEVPQTKTEFHLLNIWKDLLKVESLGINDNFFEIGGHSILAMRTISRIQLELGVVTDLTLLFKNPTVKLLAKEIDNLEKEQKNIVIPVIPESQFYETSQAQKRLWLAEQMEVNRSVYNIIIGFEIIGELAIDKLTQSIYHVINKHEILRTNFIDIDGTPYQKIEPFSENQCAFEIFEKAEVIATARTIFQEEEAYEFNLEKDSLIRFRLITNGNTHALIINMHHIIGDGWSIQTLQTDILKAYEQLKITNSILENNLPIQYKDYAFWHNRQLEKENLEAEEYWLKTLKNIAERPDLPLDKKRGTVRNTESNTVEFTLGLELSNQVKKISNTLEVRTFIVLQALLKTYLAQYIKSEDITIGTAVAGRNHPQLEDQIGFYINMLVLRSHISDTKSLNEIVSQLNLEAEDAFKHQTYPYDLLVNKLEPVRKTARNALFDVLISYYDGFETDEDNHELKFVELEGSETNDTQNKYDLIYTFQTEEDGAITISIKYLINLFYDSTIKEMKNNMLGWFEWILSNPSTPLSSYVKKNVQQVDLVDDFL
ncbi:amino acid adenylation domain-containing protein [Tenacibaculum sp. TC6]|uniref:amino acid adenylation domain-containing protein n=1 Tax=Tenacibaculum sp. TC6 TaxID=3423223 RepID=UPI003D369AD2